MRHASAPGTFDPPGFVLGECGTQRKLGDEGRAQARAISAWLAGEFTGSGDAVLLRHESRSGGTGPVVLASLAMLAAHQP